MNDYLDILISENLIDGDDKIEITRIISSKSCEDSMWIYSYRKVCYPVKGYQKLFCQMGTHDLTLSRENLEKIENRKNVFSQPSNSVWFIDYHPHIAFFSKEDLKFLIQRGTMKSHMVFDRSNHFYLMQKKSHLYIRNSAMESLFEAIERLHNEIDELLKAMGFSGEEYLKLYSIYFLLLVRNLEHFETFVSSCYSYCSEVM